MSFDSISRRNFVKFAGAGALAAAVPSAFPTEAEADSAASNPGDFAYQRETRERRMAWWKDARFGMFIHYGLYSVIGQQEWAMESEGVPIPQYQLLAKHLKPKPGFATEWVKLAKRAGQKYMVLTTKHHEGFCLFDTKLTNYNAVQQGPKRDLVREYVDAARAEGMRIGFYYSLMDWHHPDGAICKTNLAARKRFVAYTFGLLRDLLSNYGKIDILWYDEPWPLTPKEWDADAMNRMVFSLQPDIIVNNRNGLRGDFSTPEHKIKASGRAWESCETMNRGWGYQRADHEFKTAREVLIDLTLCAQQGGNYLLDVGPEPDGTVRPPEVNILDTVGRWLKTNGETVYGTDGGASISFGNYDNFTRKGNTLYIQVYFWPSNTPAANWLTFFQKPTVVAVGGLNAKVLSAKLLKTGQKLKFTQDEFTLRFPDLPVQAPDDPITVIACECDQPPVVNHHRIRPLWPRYGVGMPG